MVPTVLISGWTGLGAIFFLPIFVFCPYAAFVTRKHDF